ncbi:SEC10 (YLR166C) [Zygosaccharomyces parabailii]|uniref:BN860_13102g1_1 n=1 Tax=Zygosaccharomyces bailii (strain CLIB 213 / ATCC 58445 / CBS 680 / BCRC 21525 / NBRC 1098 / NCYC 1416 / NRRL Y-2227) TaxID=1333698 RepID=A0A8J2T412_ZYGB2|nr:SEC10 (YLR166C) [Zygosaccharomyces parabailii]CDF87729.1 BN860_13102g1_1 [Zygosaccharomyces bailii CLIB 213]
MNSLYDLDPRWRKLLSPNNFLGGLTVNEFVEELSKDHSLRGADGTAETTFEKLNPKPYIRTFESILKELNVLSEQSSSRKAQLVEQVSAQELEHAENVVQLSQELKKTMYNYEKLDSQLTNVTQVVSPLGEKLEVAIRRKKAYIKSVELISHYNAFYTTGESKFLEDLRSSPNFQKKTQAALLVKNLLLLARKVETSSIPRTVETASNIEKYSEILETDLLESFNNAYRVNNFSQLNEIALILNHFNGGVNVIQSFINQHEYFIDTAQIDLDAGNQILLEEEFKGELVDSDKHGVIYEKTMVAHLSDIETVIKNESKVVKRVFENRALLVMQKFMQRIFAQKVEGRVDLLLSTAGSLSSLAYVRMLHALYSLLGQFTKDLADFFKLQEIDRDGILSTTVEQSFTELFSKYLYDKSRYFDIEKRSLESILIEKTTNFNITHDKDIRSRSLSGKLNNNLDSGFGLHEIGSSSKNKFVQLNNFFKSRIDRERLTFGRNNSLRSSNPPSSDNSQTDSKASQNEEDGFSLQEADEMLKCVVESIGRIMELVPNMSGTYIYEILEVMLTGIVGSYVETALEVAYSRAVRMDSSKPPQLELSFMKYISLSTEILSLTSASVKAVFLPLLSNTPSMKKQTIEMTNNQIRRCELLINIILEEVTRIFLNKFSTSLAKQKKKDFFPKSQELLDHDTLPAVEVVNVLNSLHTQAALYLKAKNLEAFLSKIGNGLYDLLIAHYGKFQVSSTGGIIVTKDIIGYQTAIEDWRIPALYDKFTVLRELANLFTVQPDLLDSLTKEGHLADVNKDIISNYISHREDFNHENFMGSVRLNLRQYT